MKYLIIALERVPNILPAWIIVTILFLASSLLSCCILLTRIQIAVKLSAKMRAMVMIHVVKYFGKEESLLLILQTLIFFCLKGQGVLTPRNHQHRALIVKVICLREQYVALAMSWALWKWLTYVSEICRHSPCLPDTGLW